MPTPVCTQCGAVIPAEDINVARDVAFCRTCNLAQALSALTHGGEVSEEPDLTRPPDGAWYRNDGGGMVAGASHRSWATALGSLVFGLFWNGITSVFVLVALAASLKHLGISVPDWFPAPNMNNQPMSVGMTLFLWLFLTPFILIGGGMMFAFFSSLFGRTEVRVYNSQGTVFTGIGPLGRTRRFDVSTLKKVGLQEAVWRNNDGTNRQPKIILETGTGKKIKFGGMLNDERRDFVLAALRKATR